MSKTLEKVMVDAMELPPALRAFMAEQLIESLDRKDVPELSTKWKKEIRRRSLDVDHGLTTLHSAETVFKKAFASLA
jgi:putative addiction module component (TIGR02574 family)